MLMSQARISFVTLISKESSPMPPLWAAKLISNLSKKVKDKIVGVQAGDCCDFVFIKTFGVPQTELPKIDELHRKAKEKNSDCFVVVGGWGPTLSPRLYMKVSDVIIPGVYGEAFSPFNQLLTYWIDGTVDRLYEIDGIGIANHEPKITEMPTSGNSVDWEFFCAKLGIKLFDYVRFKENVESQVLFLPFQTGPFSCSNYLTPLLQNLKREKIRVGCAGCGAAIAASSLVKKLKEINRLDLLDSMYVNHENYVEHLQRIENEIRGLHKQLRRERYNGRKIYYLANDSVSLSDMRLVLDVLERKFEKETFLNLVDSIEVYVRPEFLKTAINEVNRKGFLNKFSFKVKVWYWSQKDLDFSYRNNTQEDIQQYFDCLRQHKECRYIPYFSLTSRRSTSKDFVKNLDALIRSIGEGIYWYIVGWEKTDSQISKKAEEYLCCLNNWIENPALSDAFLDKVLHSQLCRKIYSDLEQPNLIKKAQATFLLSTLKEISQER